MLNEDYLGSWLCETGPYQEYIAHLSSSNPGLTRPDPANKHCPLKCGNATVVLLDAPSTGQPKFQKQHFKSSADLRKHFEKTNDADDRRRVYIMEGLAPDYISVVGGHFFMDPLFFQRQERNGIWSNEYTPTSNLSPQPASLDRGKTFHIQYRELRQFQREMEDASYFCQRTGRYVDMIASRKSKVGNSTTGILQRKVGFWCGRTSAVGWDAVILCDPQLFGVAKAGGMSTPKNEAFQGGYLDFLPTPAHDEASSKARHPRHSMLSDLCHYFENHSDVIGENEMRKYTAEYDWVNPTAASFFLKKVVAAHYLQLVDYIQALLPSLELHLTTAWFDAQDQRKSLQTISRCKNYRDDIENTLLSLGYPLGESVSTPFYDWRNCKTEFQYLYMRLNFIKQRADNLMQTIIGLAFIASNHQNLEEAKRAKGLNLLALLFVPLAYTSSLFSMQEDFMPGAGKFWIYWASAIPAIAVTIFAMWLLDSVIGNAVRWMRALVM